MWEYWPPDVLSFSWSYCQKKRKLLATNYFKQPTQVAKLYNISIFVEPHFKLSLIPGLILINNVSIILSVSVIPGMSVMLYVCKIVSVS